ncbi:MAG TPA: hydrolase [Ruminococcaceae bacterium]|nr:hydrolase [Oscillospiraceae bacterium]
MELCVARSMEDELFFSCVKDLLDHPEIQKLEDYFQHSRTTRLKHSLNVAYYSFKAARFLGWDHRSAARGAMLHDLFHYERKEAPISALRHLRVHPRMALENAERNFFLNEKERDIILKHMWLCTLKPPKYRESFLVSFVDKFCAVMETFCAGVI